MLKFTLTQKDGSPALGFGLTQENIERLIKGQPIAVDLREMGVDAKIMIFYGKTIDDVYSQIAPMVGDETIVHQDAPDESYVAENEKAMLKAIGYNVKYSKRGWSPIAPLGKAIIRGWAKTEAKAWWLCWSHLQRQNQRND